jgi:hypothetical protein
MLYLLQALIVIWVFFKEEHEVVAVSASLKHLQSNRLNQLL